MGTRSGPFNALRGNSIPAAVVVVVVIDLDRFEDTDDWFGHAIVDEVLVRCARGRRRPLSAPGATLAATVGSLCAR